MTTAIDITTANPLQVWGQVDQLVAATQPPPPPNAPLWDVIIHDNQGYPIGQISDYISLTWDRNRTLDTATLVLKQDDPWGPVCMTAVFTVVPIVIMQDDLKLWSGRVDEPKRDTVEGITTYTCSLIGDNIWFYSFCVFPNFLLPIQIQEPKEAFFIGPAVTNIIEMGVEQCLRYAAGLGLLELIESIVSPSNFLTQVIADGVLAPVVWVPVDPFTDTSKWTAMTARMEDEASVFATTVQDCGLLTSGELWRPGDPQPWSDWFVLTVPTVVLRVRDFTNITGLTGTALDGLIGFAVDVADTLFGDILGVLGVASASDSLSTDATNPYGQGIIAQALGYSTNPPWVIFEDGPYSGIAESHIAGHHPQAWTVIAGGKSPQWVNQGIDLLLQLAISELLAAFGASGISSDLLNGVFDDVVLAFQPFPDVFRFNRLGKFGRPEKLVSAGSAAYTPDALIAGEAGLWDTRGWYSFTLLVTDQRQYTYMRDFELCSPVSWVEAGVIYTDYLYKVTGTDDREKRRDLRFDVGDAKAQEAPEAKLARRVGEFMKAFNAAMLAQN